MKSGINNRQKYFSKSEKVREASPKGDAILPSLFVLGNHTTHLHTYKMNFGQQVYKITRKSYQLKYMLASSYSQK